MLPAIHIAVTAWRRPRFTERVVASLAEHNDLSEFSCWYGLDGRCKVENEKILDGAGFTRLVRNRKRKGTADLTARLLARVAAHANKDDYVLLLQNDWECCRPIPVAAIHALMEWPNVGCFRLYGEYKERENGELQHRCNPRHAGLPGRPTVDWVPHKIGEEALEIGCIHWGHPPAVTKLSLAVALTRGAESEWRTVRRSGDMDFLTARVVENVFWHIGYKRRYKGR